MAQLSPVTYDPRSRLLWLASALLLLLAACSDSRTPEPGVVADGGGRDLGRLDAGSVDLGAAPDAGPRGSCDPQDARELACPDPGALCDGPDTWQWNGDRCVPIACGACEGADCTTDFTTQSECEAAHASCEATACRASGGDWLFWAEECDHYRCGRPTPAVCIRGIPVCDCGPQRIFDAARGCVADVSCTMEPPIPNREIQCTGSGGTWENICCDTVCGVFCGDDCAAPACNCGPGRVFEEGRGCIESSRCFDAAPGAHCEPRGRCGGGTICCQDCGGAGCSGDATCRAPTCDADPLVDECGNRRDAP